MSSGQRESNGSHVPATGSRRPGAIFLPDRGESPLRRAGGQKGESAPTPPSPVQNRHRPGGMESRWLPSLRQTGRGGSLARFPSLPDPCRWMSLRCSFPRKSGQFNCSKLFPRPGGGVVGRCAAPQNLKSLGARVDLTETGGDSLQEKRLALQCSKGKGWVFCVYEGEECFPMGL